RCSLTLQPRRTPRLSRRLFLQLGAGLAGLTAAGQVRPGENASALFLQADGRGKPANRGKPTTFQIACMTLPYSRFPLARALTGIQSAGYRFVAWGTTHREASGSVPVMAPDAPPAAAKELGRRCRDLGLEPRMMFSMIYPED